MNDNLAGTSPVEREVRPAIPTRADVDALMRACQRGFTVRQWNQAHSVLAECYGTLGALMLALERMASWLEGDCYCPCCGETRQCLDGCTFAADCPDDAERMEGARFALYGPNGAA